MPKFLLSFFRFSKKKYIIGGIVLLILIWFFFFSGNKNSVTPQFAEVKKQNLKQEVSASGILTGKDSANLHFKTSGKLAYIRVKAGDTVDTGDTIASLDTQDLTIALRQAENTLRDKRAIVDKIKEDLKDVTNETYTQRQTRTTAEVAQDNAYDSVLSAQRAFQDAVITSPINGIITKVDKVPGQIVTASDTIAQVVDFSQIVFETDVDEADISKVLVGQKAEVTLNAYGEKIFAGKVSEIVPQTKTTSNGATVVTVKITLEDSTIQHIAGLNGQVNIIQKEKKDILSIPAEALYKGNMVLVKNGSGVTAQKVVIGFKTDSDLEVIDGLKKGDQVVTNPIDIAPTQQSRNPLLRIFRGVRVR